MSTSLHKAAETLQALLPKCDEVDADIKHILSAETAAIDAGFSKGEVTAAKAHLENAARNIRRVKSELQSFGIGAAETNTIIETKVDGDADTLAAPLPCGCEED